MAGNACSGRGTGQTAHSLKQTRHCDGFDQCFVRTKESGDAAIVEITRSTRDSDDLDARKLLMEHPGEFKAVHIRHQDIRNDQIDGMALEMSQAVPRRGYFIDGIPGSFQRPPEELSGRSFIVDQKNFSQSAVSSL